MSIIHVRRIRILDICLMVVISLFCFSCLVTFIYNGNVNLIKKLSSGFYDDTALLFKASETELDYITLYRTMPNNSVLYGKFFGQGEDIRGVLYKGNYIPPALKDGRFFSESDFNSNSYVAVIGKEVPISKTMNEKNYVEFNQKDYEVIGTIGFNIPTRMDRTILLNLNADNINSSTEFTVSSSTIQNSLNFIGEEKVFGQVTLFEKDNVNILHIIDRDNNQIITSVIFLAILFVNCLSVLFFWIEKKNNEMKIKWSNGYAVKKILLDMWKDFSRLLSLSVIMASCSILIFSKFMQHLNLIVWPFLLGIVGLFLLFSFFVIVFSHFKLIRR